MMMMNRRDFRHQLERILEQSSRLRDWPNTREQLTAEIMHWHDKTVEDALEEYEQALNADDEANVTHGRSSLECPEDVQFEEVSEG